MTQLPSRAKMLMRIAIKPGQRSVNPFAPARQEGVSREPAPPARSGTTGHELSLSLVQAHGQQVRFTASKPAPVGHPSPREKCPEKERGLLDRVVVVVVLYCCCQVVVITVVLKLLLLLITVHLKKSLMREFLCNTFVRERRREKERERERERKEQKHTR